VQFLRRETLGRDWGFLELANLGEKHCRTPTLDLLHPTLEILGRAGSHALWASKTPWPASGSAEFEFVAPLKARSTFWGVGTITS
jgi:hypothetical protein